MSLNQELSPFSPRSQSQLLASSDGSKEPMLRLLALLEASVKREEAARRRIDELYEQIIHMQEQQRLGRQAASKTPSPLPPSASPSAPVTPTPPDTSAPFTPPRIRASPIPASPSPAPLSPAPPSPPLSPLPHLDPPFAKPDTAPSSPVEEGKYPSSPSPSDTTPDLIDPLLSTTTPTSPPIPPSPASAVIDAFESITTPPQDEGKEPPITLDPSPPPVKGVGQWVVHSWGELAATLPHLIVHVLLLELLHCVVLLIVNDRARYQLYDAIPYPDLRDAVLPRTLYWSTLSALKAKHLHHPILTALLLFTALLFRRLIRRLLVQHGESASTRQLLASSFPSSFSHFAFGVVHFAFVFCYWRVYRESTNVLDLAVILPIQAAYWGQDALASLLFGSPMRQPLQTAASLLLFTLSFAFSSLEGHVASILGPHMMPSKATAIMALLFLTFLLSLPAALRYVHAHGPFSRVLRTQMLGFIFVVYVPLAVAGVLVPAAASLADVYYHFLHSAAAAPPQAPWTRQDKGDRMPSKPEAVQPDMRENLRPTGLRPPPGAKALERERARLGGEEGVRHGAGEEFGRMPRPGHMREAGDGDMLRDPRMRPLHARKPGVAPPGKV